MVKFPSDAISAKAPEPPEPVMVCHGKNQETSEPLVKDL